MAEPTLRLRAPAKINLFLHIIGRREDGYHQLQTAFQFLDLCDQLEFTASSTPDIELSGDGCDLPAEENLICKAAVALQEASTRRQGARINVRKVLPMGGGIGGGSSDAASTLLALNALWDCRLSLAELAEIGLQLGADVPVFVYGKAAFAEGVGERLQPIEPEQPWYLLIKPPCHVATGRIFSQQELTRNTSPIKIAAFLSGATLTRNDCLPVVQTLYPEIAAVMAWLGDYARAQLTGTGACVFAAFETEQAARKVQRAVPANWQAFVAKGLNESPAHKDLVALQGH